MSIQKLNSAKLIQEKIPFTIHSNYVLQNLTDLVALAIWCYLTSLPDDWEVHRNQIMRHFDIGRDKLASALKFLNENKLIEYVQGRTEDGKFSITYILVKNGIDFEVIHKTKHALLKTSTTDFPDYGETAPTNTIKNTNQIKDKNKSFYKDQKKYKSENHLNSKSKADWKTENEMKPGWANKDVIKATADVSSQSNSHNPGIPTSKSEKSVEAFNLACRNLPRSLMPKRLREMDIYKELFASTINCEKNARQENGAENGAIFE